MAQKIRFKRGGTNQIPPKLDPGEPYFDLAQGRLYIGGSANNVSIAGGSSLEINSLDFQGILEFREIGGDTVPFVLRTDEFSINENNTSVDFDVWDDNGDARIYMDATEGKLGFGTLQPHAPNHFWGANVTGGASPNANSLVYMEDTATLYLQLRTSASNPAGVYVGRTDTSAFDTGIVSTSANQLLLVANGASSGHTIAENIVATLKNGIVVSENASGGDQGRGTINVSSDIFKNGAAYNAPDYVFEKYFTGDVIEHADKIGSHNYKGLLPIPELKNHIQGTWQLPYKEKTHGLFDGSDWLLARVEELTLYIIELHERIEELERQNGNRA